MLRVILAAALVASAGAVRADTVNLVGGWNMTWYITNSLVSPTEAIQVQDATTPATPVFWGYDLGLIFQRVEGSGQIALDTASNPSSNSIVPSWLFPAPTLGSGLNGGAGSEAYIYSEAATFTNYDVPNSATDLTMVDFMPGSSQPTPGSVFDVYSDSGFSDYVDSGGTSTPYANNATSNFLLGTITVVPEPGTMALLGVACLGLLVYTARRRVRRRDARATFGA